MGFDFFESVWVCLVVHFFVADRFKALTNVVLMLGGNNKIDLDNGVLLVEGNIGIQQFLVNGV